jgi:hypothetical protein
MILSAIREQRANLELIGRLKGELATGTVAVFMRLGVRDEAELAEVIVSGRKLRSLQDEAATSLERYREDACAPLRDVLKQRLEWRAGVLSRLGSEGRRGHRIVRRPLAPPVGGP